ncbi:MAG: GreA/GreB family elongation factor, partial [Bacteroidia bacterium]|nr:GreA/GreB family elongation factor [Bacteroidia bacterium]
NWIRRTLKIVRHPKLLKKAVRLNSVVLLWHSVLKKIVKFRIVLPNNADLKTRKLSVFAPISMAILGKQENDLVKVKIGGIEKELRVLKVINR